MKTLPQRIRNSLSVLIQEYIKLDKHKKLLFLSLSIFIALIFSYIIAKAINSSTQKPIQSPSNLINSTILKDNEKLISLKINNSSKYILESLSTTAVLTILGKNSKGKTFILSKHAKLIDFASTRNQATESQEYVVTIILNEHEAYEILKQESNIEFSLMLNSSAELIESSENRIKTQPTKLQIIDMPNSKEDI